MVGTLLWQIRRSMSEVSQNWQKFGSNLLKLKVMKSSPHFPRKIKQKSRQNSSFSIQWNGQAPRETNQFEQNTGTKISLSSKISLKFAPWFCFPSLAMKQLSKMNIRSWVRTLWLAVAEGLKTRKEVLY